MTEIKEDVVSISISEDDIVESISLLTDMLEFVKTRHEAGHAETEKALNVAVEVMSAFWCEKFGEEENDDQEHNQAAE